MSSFLPIQTQAFLVYGSGVVIGNTTLTLASFKDIDGNNIAMQGTVMTGTVEPSSGVQEEQIIFTGVTQNANGTATLTGVSSVGWASPYTQTSGFVKNHAGNTTFVLSDTAYLYSQYANLGGTNTFTGTDTFNISPIIPTVSSSQTTQAASVGYVNSVAIAGGAKASNTVFGISELTVAPATASVPLAVGDNDPRMPTAGQALALAGNFGTPGSGNKYVTEAGVAPVGAIQMYAGATAPTNWLLCDGTSYLQATYAALFAIIGTTYGSADGSHFNVPDMRGRVPAGVGTGTGGGATGTGLPTGGSALTAVARGTWKGEETHQLTVGELANHNHAIASVTGGSGQFPYSSTNALITFSTTGIQSAGSDTPHNNIQPVMGVNFIIKT
jgi:microcystin-dependent protein